MATVTESLLLFLLVSIFLPFATRAFPFGAPPPICLAPYPHHDINVKQTGTPPFNITVSSSTYTANASITVTITSRNTFEGYLLKVRRQTGEIQSAFGSWSGCTATSLTYMSVFPYSPNDNNCVTHSANDKVNSLTCTWKAPANNIGNLAVSATIVYEFETFYTDVTVNINSAMTSPVVAPTTPIATTLTQIPTMYDCGSSKSCVLYPYNCWLSNTCYYMISYRPTNNGTVKIEMLMPASYQYAVFGLSKDEKMGKDQLVICNLMADGTPMIQTAYGITYAALPSLDAYVQNRFMNVMQDWRGDNYLTCSFELPTNFSFGYYDAYYPSGPQLVTETLNLNEKNYIFFGFGDIYSGSFASKPHVVTPMISYYNLVLNTSQWDIQYFYGLRRHVRIHSTLTSIAWLLFAPLGHIIAAHLRSNLKHKLFDRQIWFIFHIICMIVTTCCTIAGFIFILAINMQWKTDSTPHGVLACVTLGFVFVNILAGLFRPSPDSKRRVYFNVFHSLVGHLSRCCSIVTIWLAITLPKMNRRFQLWAYAVIGIWTCFEFLFFVFAFIKRTVAFKRYKAYYYNKPQNNEGDHSVIKLRDRFVRHINNWWFAFYAIIIIGLFSAFIVDIWLN